MENWVLHTTVNIWLVLQKQIAAFQYLLALRIADGFPAVQ